MICSKEVVDQNGVGFIPAEYGDDLSVKPKNPNLSIFQIGKKLLQYAREGDVQNVIEILSKGAPLTTDWLGTSPLHLAVMNNHYETCEILLRAGVGKDCKTKVDRTPLHFAGYEGHAEIAKLLLKKGAIVDCKDMLDMTPLHWAVERRHMECARVLISYGAKPDSVCRFNRTPLTIATDMNWTEMVRELQNANILETTSSIENNVEAKENKPSTTKFSLDYDEMLNLNNEKPIEEMETDCNQSEKDPQNVFGSFTPRVEDATEATLQLLKAHGITMLPTDNTNTVNSAIQSGRKIVLSDAGKLVLKDVNLQKQTKPTDIKKNPIILPSKKIKNQKIVSISNQLLTITSQDKPNILQKFPIDSLKAATNAGFNFVQLPKNASITPVKVTNLNKSAKIINNVPIKTVPKLIVNKNESPGISTSSLCTMKSDYIKLGPMLQSGNKIIKLKNGSNVEGNFRIVMKKSEKPVTDIMNNIQTAICGANEGLINEMNPIPAEQSQQSNENLDLLRENSQINEISMLKSELEIAKVELEYYKKKYSEARAQLLLYKKNRLNCQSAIDDA